MKRTCMIAPTIIITMIIILPQVRIMVTDLLMVKAVTDNLEVSHNKTEAKDLNIINVNFRIIYFREIKQIATEVKALAEVLSNLEDVVMAGPIIRVAMERISISTTHMTHRQNSMAHCSLCGGFNHSPKHCYKGEHDINKIMEKMSINPHQQQQGNLYQ